jgi:hypothetical protein
MERDPSLLGVDRLGEPTRESLDAAHLMEQAQAGVFLSHEFP